jgi:hypothetical protein
LDAESFLQPHDTAADKLGGETKPPRRSGEAALIHHLNQDPHVFELIHYHIDCESISPRYRIINAGVDI